MTQIDQSLLDDFQKESKNLISQMNDILSDCEDSPEKAPLLADYGQLVDRIMGGSQSLVLSLSKETPEVSRLQQIGNYSALCKAVGYKTSQLKQQNDFYNICVAFLLDATEVLEEMTENLFESELQNEQFEFNKTFIERLKWVSDQFGAEFRASVAVVTPENANQKQNEIDELLKKLGLD